MSTLKVHGRCVNTDNCSTVEASKCVGDFWNLWIVRVLLPGRKRFSSIHEEISTINKATLVAKLKTLYELGIVDKVLDQDLKPYYVLTAKGEGLKPVIDALEAYGKEHFA